MYVDAVDQCNELAFTLGPSTSEEVAAGGLTAASVRSWNIKVCKKYVHVLSRWRDTFKHTPYKYASFLFPIVIFRSANMTVTITI